MNIITVPDGTKGFDANVTLTAGTAAAFKAHGYGFAIRYVRRVTPHSYDLSAGEAITILKAGLGLMVVQHVAPEGWHPNATLGTAYGQIAAMEAQGIGYPATCTLWCDLEGVSPGTPTQPVIDFCNRWFDAVKAAGFWPGLYVGFECGISAQDLYYKLKFQRYWGAYNQNADEIPAIRGNCMKQSVMTRESTVSGIPFGFDVDVVGQDAKGGLPTMLAPDGWFA